MTTPLDRPPDWVTDAIFYQVFPDRFARSGKVPQPHRLEPWDSEPTLFGFKGGDLLGVEERLDWIQDLGCNAIYLNPIFQSAANHRYHTHDYYRVGPLLGGDEAFQSLLAACHDRGMRVVLDGVFNHAARGFFQFNHVLEQGEHSPYLDWFHIHGFPLNAYDQRHGPPQYGAWWGMPALPEFNTDNPEVREYLMQVGEHWVEQGIDGWRLDVPEEIKTEGFWEEFRRRVRARNPEAYLVGEIWGDASWWTVTGERFDGTMNYLLCGYGASFATGGNIDQRAAEGLQYRVEPLDAAGYAAAVQGLADLYPPRVLAAHLNLLGSHDTARILSVAGGDAAAVRLAALLMFASPGAPCVFYGDEIGLTGGKDPECRASFPWDREEEWNRELLETFTSLARLRRENPALRRGGYRVRHAPAGGQLYIFQREHEGRRLVVAANAGDRPAAAELAEEAGDWELVWGKGTAVRGEGETIRASVPPRTGAVWTVAG